MNAPHNCLHSFRYFFILQNYSKESAKKHALSFIYILWKVLAFISINVEPMGLKNVQVYKE